jgi:hypothetical protein
MPLRDPGMRSTFLVQNFQKLTEMQSSEVFMLSREIFRRKSTSTVLSCTPGTLEY